MSGETLKALADLNVLSKGVSREIEHVEHAVKDLRKRVDRLKEKTAEVMKTLPPDTTVTLDYSEIDGAMQTLEAFFGEE